MVFKICLRFMYTQFNKIYRHVKKFLSVLISLLYLESLLKLGKTNVTTQQVSNKMKEIFDYRGGRKKILSTKAIIKQHNNSKLYLIAVHFHLSTSLPRISRKALALKATENNMPIALRLSDTVVSK